LFFTANDGVTGTELWMYDGVASRAAQVANINPGAASSSPSELAVVAGSLFFSADDGIHGRELWSSNGTSAGTLMLYDAAPGILSSTPAYITDGGGLVFYRDDDNETAAEPWALNLGEVRSVGFTSGSQLAWGAIAGSNGYNVYRGSVSSGATFSYNEQCAANRLTSPAWGDPASPAAGQLFYYLVTSVSAGVESTPGEDSSGNPRPLPNSCPAF
jgi:ELWxxDGT repeat protein